jgi:hypothetical protein
MLQNRQSMTYNNSRLRTIYNTMLSLDYDSNRVLLFLYKNKLYTRYLSYLVGGNIPRDKSFELSNMYQQLISELTDEEYNVVFEIEVEVPLTTVFVDSGYTFYVIRRKPPRNGPSYFIYKNLTRDFLFNPLQIYTFDVSDPSNLGSRLSFSEDEEEYNGIEYIGTPGAPGAKILLRISPGVNLLYTMDAMNPYANRDGYYPTLLVRENKFEVQNRGNILYVPIRQYSNIAVYEDNGPRFSINDTIHPIVHRESNHRHYQVTYGTYYLEVPKIYACTLLNKGYEDCVSFIGDPECCTVDTVYGATLAPGPPQEGEYSFFYGKVTMTVKKPFPFDMTFYSRSFGFMGGAGILHFIEPYVPVEGADVISLPHVNTILAGDVLRFNRDTSDHLYGLSMGTYIVYLEAEVAFLNRGRENLFTVYGAGLEGTTPDDIPCMFYRGKVMIHIQGNFDKCSMCTRSGYSGGYKRLVYNAYYGAPNDSPFTKTLYAQNTLNLLDNVISFNQDSTYQVYTLPKGEYMVFQKHSSYPITLLNKGKEDLITLETLQPNFVIQGIGPDGNVYLFYYGVFRIRVKGDFNQMSVYSRELNNGLGAIFPLFTYGNS